VNRWRLTLVRHRGFGLAAKLARLGFDAWTVVGLRIIRMGEGGRAAVLERRSMTIEKAAAMLEAQAALGMAVLHGSSVRKTAGNVIASYRRRVTANRRRLMRKK
jgi:hypothetical protein